MVNRKLTRAIVVLSFLAFFTISFLSNTVTPAGASTSDLSIPYEGLVLRWFYAEELYYRGTLQDEANATIIYVYREKISPTVFAREQISPERVPDTVDITTREVLSGPSKGTYTGHWIRTDCSIGDSVIIENVAYAVKAKNVTVNLPSVTPERWGARISCFELEYSGKAANFTFTDLIYYDMRAGIMVLGVTEAVYTPDPDFTVQVLLILEETQTDNDEDGLTDLEELFVTLTDPLKADTDGDGLSDKKEANIQTDPLDSDSDGDGLKDGEEVNIHGTNPLNADTDNDGLYDGFEVQIGASPLKTDSDSDFWNDSVDVMANNMFIPNAPIILFSVIPVVGIVWWWKKRRTKIEMQPAAPAPPHPPPMPPAKKYCIGCGAEIVAEAIYCPKCGQKQG